MDRNFPYVVLVNVANIAELQGLRDKAKEATRRPFVGDSGYRVVERNEAVFFYFGDSAAALLFQMYCDRNQIPSRRIGDGDWTRAR